MKLAFSLLVFLFTSFSSSLANNLVRYGSSFEKAEIPNFDFGEKKPNLNVFSMALKGYSVLKSKGEIIKPYLSLIDFDLSANEERLWVIDMQNFKVVYNTLVAHGRNSGEEFAKQFSNQEGSFQSSLGFYKTSSIYIGKHGKSLKLLGLEKNINDAAYQRGIVVHGADYVSREFIQTYGRLGRSQGCPAVPVEICEDLINLIQEGSCLFIYKTDASYLSQSTLI
ncbi:MAG: murein L,D-transpeptidase catalytic domain family protein [Chitinophagales bacterium]|nr:murein L,D-transpeptidase catalytic domain family protein [Bacteroidota bacterium]MCB9256742.1 murein L,D-transpeptidase catalytic domain family protein [Chitinophagales bacterium]